MGSGIVLEQDLAVGFHLRESGSKTRFVRLEGYEQRLEDCSKGEAA